MGRVVKPTGKNRLIYIAVGSTILMVLYAQFILGHFSSCFLIPDSPNSLGLSFGYDIKVVQCFFDVRTVEQLDCYAQFIRVWDTIFPVIYTLMYSCWMIYLFKRWPFVLCIPLLHMIADWIENYAELLMLDAYINSSALSEKLVSFGSTTTMIKWSLSIVTYSIILFGIIRKLKLFFASRKLH